MTELGMFLPVGKNGYIVSAAAPQYHPSYAMLKVMTRLVEDLGFSFVLSPVKYRGWGGPTEFADYVLESFEVMAALAEATDRIRLYGYVARLRQMCEDAERLLEARHGLAIGRPRHGLVLHLPAVRQGFVPHLAPQGMMRQALDRLGFPLPRARFKGPNDPRVQSAPALLQEAAIRHLVGEGVLEGVRALGKESHLVQKLGGLEVNETTMQRLIRIPGDSLQQGTVTFLPITDAVCRSCRSGVGKRSMRAASTA